MDWNRVDAIVIHHTAVDPRSPEDVALLLPAAEMAPEDELNHIRVIHLYHKSLGYGGFGYHLIVFPSGRCYYVVDLRLWGAHVGGKNDSKLGVVLAADCRTTRPGDAQFQGVWEAVRFIRDSLTFALRIGPHSEWTNTSCPGMAWPLPEEDDAMTDEERARLESLEGEVADMWVVVDRIRGEVPPPEDFKDRIVDYPQPELKSGWPPLGIWGHIGHLYRIIRQREEQARG